MTQASSKPMWSFNPKEWATTVRQLGPHPCGCEELYMVTHHTTGHAPDFELVPDSPANVATDIMNLPEFWATGVRDHYRDCPKRAV